MAMPMGPPPSPGFSLRVQIFAPHANASKDTPIHSLRVLTTPESTVQEFCVEVSRRYEISYGETLAPKRCQDEKGFDILMTDTVRDVFVNLDIIRITQDSANPGVRDSVPPTSALRFGFDPSKSLGRKREREGSVRPNGSPSSNAWQPSKRQRVSDPDPDKPLPSRELNFGGTIDEGEEPGDEIVPNSQREAAYEKTNGTSRHIRDDPRISETPSPPPELFAHLKNGSADRQGGKIDVPDTNDPIMSQMSIPSPFGPAALRAQNSASSKSASYHIPRPTERGASVSTAATSPLSGDQQGVATNGTRTPNKRKLSDPILPGPRINGKPSSTSTNGDAIYDNVPSDSEKSTRLERSMDKVKPKRSSQSRLPGLDWARTLNTPPIGSRRTSRSQDRITSNGELPLTPNSKEREQRQRQNEQANEAREARMAAAAAAEQRKREEDVRARALQVEKDLAEQRLRDQKLNEEREAEEKRLEQQRIREAKAAEVERKQQEEIAKKRERERLAKEAKATQEKERREAVRLEREKAKAHEADRERQNEATRLTRLAKEIELALETGTKSTEPSEHSKASTPDRSKATPIRPQSSSTAFIPSGRKSALKAPSSQAAGSSSPVLARTMSAESSNLNQADLPSTDVRRRVSFLDEAPANETPKDKPSRAPILPPARGSATKTTPKPAIKSPAPTVGPVKKSTTPILPPSMKRISNEPSTTPLVQSAIAPPPLGLNSKPPSAKIPLPVTKSSSPAARSTSQNHQAPSASAKPKEATKSASPQPVRVTNPPNKGSDEEDKTEEENEVEDEDEGEEDQEDEDKAAGKEVESEDNEEDESEGNEGEPDVDEDENGKDLDRLSRMDPVQALNSSIRSPSKPQREPKPEPEQASQDEEEDEDVEMQDIQSNRSSSRSPILFNSRSTPRNLGPTKPVESASSAGDTSNDEEDDSMDEDKSVDDEEASDEEEDDEDKTITAPAPRSSPPSLPTTKPAFNVRLERKPSQRKNFTISPGSSIGDESINTQDEVDFQLTSSMYEASSAAIKSTPIPIPSSSAPRPKFAIGVSLSDMNAKKPILGSSSQANNKARPLKLAEEDDEGSEEESEEESDSDSDDEPEPSQALPKLSRPRLSKPAASESEDASSEDSESESVEEDDDDLQKHQDELAAKISQFVSQGSTQSFNDIPSPKAVKGSQSSSSSGKVKTKGGKRDHLSLFSEPKWN